MTIDSILDQILEAWRTNNRINLLLVDNISAAGMRDTLSTRGGRTVARQFAHIHNNRIWHLEKRATALSAGARKFESKEEPSKKELKQALNESCARFETYFAELLSGEGKHKCLKKGPVNYLSYFISHEAHHRGSILLTLKQCGHAVDKDTAYAIWDWDRR